MNSATEMGGLHSSRAVLFVVDGMRPDGLQQAATPVLDRLMSSGAYTLSARTVTPSITLPCHASLFLSAQPEQHGVMTNTWVSPRSPHPGLVEVLRANGRRAVAFYNWEELRDVSRPGSLGASFYPCGCDDISGDQTVAGFAATWLERNEVDFAFIYLGYADNAGHAYGWMSDEYLQAITHADSCIGQVLDVMPSGTLVAVTSDHGGHDHAHGTECEEDLTIPLILSGPGAPAGRIITRHVSIIDIAPTIVTNMGIDSPADWVGKPL